jgi:hypothetical protein
VSARAAANVIEPRFQISEFFRRLVVFGFAHVRFMVCCESLTPDSKVV